MNPAYKVAIVILTFFSPLVGIVGYFELGCWLAGENVPLSIIYKKVTATENDTLFLREFYDQGLYRYKYIGLDSNKPEIVALGTSRTMQFRSIMFGENNHRFYNAGGMIQHIRDLEEFVSGLQKETEIKMILIGVEFWWFLEDFSSRAEMQKHYSSEISKDDVYDGVAHANLFQSFFRQAIGLQSERKSPSFQDIESAFSHDVESGPKRLGWNARKYNSGFRKDGSFDYGLSYPLDEDFSDRENVVERILNKQWGDAGMNGISITQLKRFVDCLANLRSRGVEVICFLPPFSSEAVRALEASSEYNYAWKMYLTLVPEYLSQRGWVVIDASEPGKLGFDDKCMIDGLHAMETFHVALLFKIFTDFGENLEKYVDVHQLQEMLSDKETNPWFLYTLR